MSNRRVDKKSQIPTIRILTTMLAMLFSVSVYATPEFPEYRDTTETGIVISIRNPRYDYEMTYHSYVDSYDAKGKFSVEMEISSPTEVWLHIGFPDNSSQGYQWGGGQLFEDVPANRPFRLFSSGEWPYNLYVSYAFHMKDDTLEYPWHHIDLVFRLSDFLKDEDKRILYAAVDEDIDRDNTLCTIYDLRGLRIADGIQKEEVVSELNAGIYILETKEPNGIIKREKIYVK